MNPVFWFLAILILILIWFALVPFFKIIGKQILKNIYKAKKQIGGKD